jgi:PAS domain S-box-containing protein
MTKSRRASGIPNKKAGGRGRVRAPSDRDSLLHDLGVYQEELTVQNETLLRSQQELEATRDRFIELYDFAPNGYLTLDKSGTIRQVNLTGARWLGKPRRAVEGAPLMTLVVPEHRSRVLEYLRRCRNHDSSAPLTLDVTLRGGRTHRDVHLICNPDRRSPRTNSGYFVAMIDVSERNRLQSESESMARERAALAQRLITIQEEERRRIARDLHDNVGQQLTALRLKLELATQSSTLDEVRRHIDEVRIASRSLDRSLDRIASELRPTSLDLDLREAIEDYVSQWSATFGIAVQWWVSGSRSISVPEVAAVHLFRVVQEALNNVYKHANARHATVSLERHARTATLKIIDDGCGFDIRKVRTNRFGLLNMRERAVVVGGTLEIVSAPGKGTSVCLEVPLQSRHDKQGQGRHP